MIFIAHRINSISKLKNLNPKFGVEIDLRDYNKDIHIVHDPFKKGIKLSKYLKNYKHKFIICNIKSERIEFQVIKILNKFKIKNFFFLDSSFPMKVICLRKKIYNQSIRYSKFESLPKTKFFDKIKWIWFDTYDGLPENQELKKLKKNNKKVCLVCPKLHKKSFSNNLIKKFIKKNHANIDMICTKKDYFQNWEL